MEDKASTRRKERIGIEWSRALLSVGRRFENNTKHVKERPKGIDRMAMSSSGRIQSLTEPLLSS